jgi:hypothetical protein
VRNYLLRRGGIFSAAALAERQGKQTKGGEPE